MNFKPGDKVLRILPPSEHFLAWIWDGSVIEGTDDNKVVCIINIDVPRRMEFSQSTGTDLNDPDCFIIQYNIV